MIYMTGDLHGEKTRFADRRIKRLKKNDVLVVCGDFGFLWNGAAAEQKLLEWIGKRRYHVLFVEGTHDNLELLSGYPVEDWCGGKTHHISGRLRHLIRGERFAIEGKTLLALGGGQPDEGAQFGVTCWRGVLPDKDEVVAICDRLDELGWEADIIVSHQAPSNIEACINHTGSELNLLSALMNTVQRKNKFLMWCFGSYHQNRFVPPNYRCLYSELYCAGGQKHGLFGDKQPATKGVKE